MRYTILNCFVFFKNLILSPVSKLSRHRLSGAYNALTYPFFGSQYVDLSSVLKDGELSICLAPVKSREHNITAFELLSVCSLLKDNNCNNVFEIGTYDGRTTRALAMNLKTETGRVYTLNLPVETQQALLSTSKIDVHLASKVTSGERFLKTVQQINIEQLWGDSANFDFSPYYDNMDMVFIDGAHSVQYVQNDTEKAMRMIKPEGGIIVWHDAHLYGVIRYLAPWIKKNNLPVYFIKDTSLAVAAIKHNKVVDLKNLV